MNLTEFLATIHAHSWPAALVASALLATSVSWQTQYRSRRYYQQTGKTISNVKVNVYVLCYFALVCTALIAIEHVGTFYLPACFIGLALSEIFMWWQAIKKYSV